jgi:NDP-sugar pyrophosphorylase family protein
MSKVPDVVILCGGAGLRLRSVTGDAPKSMANVGERPFLELLLRQLRRSNFGRVILAVGYRKESIQSYFGEHAHDIAIRYSIESAPLGTAGALRNALGHIKSETVMVMNGDSYTAADLQGFVSEHDKVKADVSVIVVPNDGRVDCGSVSVDGQNRIVSFEEKAIRGGLQFVNAGIYLMPSKLLESIPPNNEVSLERQVLPAWISEGRSVCAYIYEGECVDIGTPERYRTAQRTLVV